MRKDISFLNGASVIRTRKAFLLDGLASRSDTITAMRHVEPQLAVPITNDQYICLTTHADHVETPGICHIRFKSLHRSQYRLHA